MNHTEHINTQGGQSEEIQVG